MSLSVPMDLTVNENGADLDVQGNPSALIAVIGCSIELDRIEVPAIGLRPNDGWMMVPSLVGGSFSPWSAGDEFDGGSFSPWNTGDVFFAGYMNYIQPNIGIQMVLLH